MTEGILNLLATPLRYVQHVKDECFWIISMISEIVCALSSESFISGNLETYRFNRSGVTDSSFSNISATSSKS